VALSRATGILHRGRGLQYPLRITEERQYSHVVKRDGEGLLAGATDVPTEDASRGLPALSLLEGFKPQPPGHQKSRCQMVRSASP
jgi:hypothetical protein